MSHAKRGQSLSVTRRLTLTAVFAALAYAAMFIFHFKVAFLTFDLKDAIIIIAGLLLGPVAALTISLLVAALELFTVSDTGWYGFIMNFASSAAFSVTCAVVYRYKKRLSGAILGLVAAVTSMTAVMLALNLLVTPLYQGWPVSEVAKIIPTLLLPFNLVKGVANAALVMILYKPIHRAMQAARLLPKAPAQTAPADPVLRQKRLKRSVLVSVAGLILLAAAIAVFYFVLHGRVELV